MAIYTKPMEHQKLISKFIRELPYFGIFADYGTGKTLCALLDVEKNTIRKTLVISTKTAIESTWPDEIRQHSNFQYVMLLGGRKHKINQLKLGLSKSHVDAGYYHSYKTNPVIFLINFDGVKNIFNALVAANFDLVIVDESTKIKSPKTERTKVIWKLGQSAERRGIMAGFPITENMSNIYAQIKFLDGGENFGNSYDAFLDKYFVKMGLRRVPKKKGADEMLQKIKPFCIRVSGSVLKLPPKVYKTERVAMTNEQRKLLDQLENYFQLEFGKVKIDTQYIFTLINKSLQICDGFIQNGIHKLDRKGNPIYDKDGKPVYDGKALEVVDTHKDDTLIDLLDEIDVDKNKVIIWTAYKFSANKIAKLLKPYNPLLLTGATEDVSAVVNNFQNKERNRVLVAIQKKASASITLTSCNHAIYYSNMWSFDERYNSEARIYRKGSEKHKSVFYTDLVVKGTVEEKVIECLKKKKSLVDELKATFGGISLDEPRKKKM